MSLKDEQEAYYAALAAYGNPPEDVRAALAYSLELLATMPLPDPAAQAAAQAQVDVSLTLYRGLDGVSPPDVVDLANRVTTHVQSNAAARMTEARARYLTADAAFLADQTVTLPQLVAHVRALTAQLGMVRDA